MKKTLLFAFLFFIVDQVIKVIVVNKVALYGSINVINNFFNITYVTNNGAAWSILSGNVLLLIIISVLALFFIIKFLIPKDNKNIFIMISYSLLLGGILGNLTDRIFRGYVIDFLDFNIFGYNFPVFNFADICITIATISILYFELKGDKFEQISNN